MLEKMNEERTFVLSEYREVMTVDQCAEALQLCTKQVRKMYHSGEIGGFRVGSAIRILRVSVEDYILRQMNKAG